MSIKKRTLEIIISHLNNASSANHSKNVEMERCSKEKCNSTDTINSNIQSNNNMSTQSAVLVKTDLDIKMTDINIIKSDNEFLENKNCNDTDKAFAVNNKGDKFSLNNKKRKYELNSEVTAENNKSYNKVKKNKNKSTNTKSKLMIEPFLNTENGTSTTLVIDDKDFLMPKTLPPFNTVGLFTFTRTYARRHDESDPNSTVESWAETLRRVVLACNSQLKCDFTREEQQELFNLLYTLKCSVAGRFLWQLGTKTVSNYGLASLQNCAYVTIDDPVKPFTWGMDMMMLGSGVGYSIQKEHVAKLPPVKYVEIKRLDSNSADYIIPDTREGWCKFLEEVLRAHFYTGKSFSYSCALIRKKGEVIRGFGGLASGPDPLSDGMLKINKLINTRAGQKMRSVDAMDLMNIIGMIVVSGNVRRSAQISLGDYTDTDFLRAKRWDLEVYSNLGEAVKHFSSSDSYSGSNYFLGKMWLEGTIPGEKKDYVKALQYLKKGNCPHLATMVEKNINSKDDLKELLKDELTVEDMKHDIHCVHNVLRFNPDMKKYLDHSTCSCTDYVTCPTYTALYDHYMSNNQDPFVKCMLGYMTLVGLGVAKDAVSSVKLFMAAGEAGNVLAKYFLGWTSFYGINRVPNWRCFSNNSVICGDTKLLSEEFWGPYKGENGGECLGIINLDLSRKCGRIGETQYPDPDVAGYNPCVTGDTWVQTDEGPRRVIDVLGKKLNVVVNGKSYSTTDKGFIKTAKNKVVLKIQTKEGYSVKVTGNHKILMHSGDWMDANKIMEGDKIMINDHREIKPWGEGNETFGQGYLIGHLIGDGTFSSKETAVLSCWGDDSMSVRNYIYSLVKNKAIKNNFAGWATIKGRDEYRLQIRYITGLAADYDVIKGNKYLTDKIEQASYDFTRGVLSGLFDTDGSIQGSQKSGFSIRLAQSNLELLERAQRMLLRIGIISRLYLRRKAGKKMMPDGKGGSKEYMCKENYELIIGGSSIKLFSEKIGFKQDNKQKKLENIIAGREKVFKDAAFYAIVKSVTPDSFQDVYDCTVPEISKFDANGIQAHNCAEQNLESNETCCLAELFLPNITSKEELQSATTYLYRICKQSLSLPCHHKKTEEVVHKNMRMGIGATGILQSSEEQKSWLSDCYTKLREYDVEYSKKRGYPTSIKLSTCKPSGTLSLLANVSAGIHPCYSRYYIRRIRLLANSPLVKISKDNGYHIEYVKNFDGTEDKTTKIVEFPCSVPEHAIVASECTAVRQLEYVKFLQKNWSDNSVSCTVYYKKEELPAIRKWLDENFADNIKSVSFLLHSGHGFKQAPYEEITKEKFLELSAKCKNIQSFEAKHKFVEESYEMISTGECASGVCPIR